MASHVMICSCAWNLLRRAEMVCIYIHSQVTKYSPKIIHEQELLFVEMSCGSMKAIIFRVFNHFANCPTLPTVFLTLAWSQGTKTGKKIETVARSPYFNTWTLSFHKERSVLQYMSASRLRNVYCDPHRKNYISSYIWPR